MANKLSDAPSYAELTAAQAAWDADPTEENGRALAIANSKCRKEVGKRYFLPDSLLT
jgi:hypothetical protein